MDVVFSLSFNMLECVILGRRYFFNINSRSCQLIAICVEFIKWYLQQSGMTSLFEYWCHGKNSLNIRLKLFSNS